VGLGATEIVGRDSTGKEKTIRTNADGTLDLGEIDTPDGGALAASEFQTTIVSAQTGATSVVGSYGAAPAKLQLSLYANSAQATTAAGFIDFTDDGTALTAASAARWNRTAFSMSGTGDGTTRGTNAPADTAAITIDYPWKYYRISGLSLTGTGASIDAHIGR
jgi:hypothetical protein